MQKVTTFVQWELWSIKTGSNDVRNDMGELSGIKCEVIQYWF